MHLPAGVNYRPRHDVLIAKDKPAVISIQTGSRYPQNRYLIVQSDYGQTISPCLKGDWEDFDRLFGFSPVRQLDAERQSTVFFGHAEHRFEPTGVRLPDISVIANFPIANPTGLPRLVTVFGCSMGRHYPQMPEAGIEEVVEFQSFGAITIDRGEGEVDFWIARLGDKVGIPSGCHATLYNLDDEDSPLVYLSVSRERPPEAAPPPRRRESDDPSQTLSSLCGPILLAYYDEHEVVFTLNRLHVNGKDRAGVRLPVAPRDRQEREIRISRGGRLRLGQLLYHELTQNPEQIAAFARRGLRIRKAGPEVRLPAGNDSPTALHVSRPLRDALGAGSEIERYFRRGAPTAPPPPPIELGGPKIVEVAAPRAQPQPLGRPLTIVVEGAGEWVEKAYRDLFKRTVDAGMPLHVFYADDTRWKKGRPRWAIPPRAPDSAPWQPARSFLQSWEIYLDKADPKHFARYQALRPDVVFVVTPDFTHCTLSRHWVGKAPLVFIEKPFDSQVANVDELQRVIPPESPTRVYGLDHYQFYAAPIPDLSRRIEEHLDGSITEARFWLTETGRVETGRVRTLQHGLTLDLLPHCVALLTYFGDISSIDDIRVLEAGRYMPLKSSDDKDMVFRSETYSKVRFTFLDFSRNGYRVPCTAVVGKGFPLDAKLLQVTGVNGNQVRIDLIPKPADGAVPNYPYDSISFLVPHEAPGHDVEKADDPYFSRPIHFLNDPLHKPQEIFRRRYELLLNDLLQQTETSIERTLSLLEGRQVVNVLDRVWRAIQDTPLTDTPHARLNLDASFPTP